MHNFDVVYYFDILYRMVVCEFGRTHRPTVGANPDAKLSKIQSQNTIESGQTSLVLKWEFVKKLAPLKMTRKFNSPICLDLKEWWGFQFL